MNNKEKHALIAKLPEYWSKRYPDAFLEYPDGSKVLREDMLDYFQDQDLAFAAIETASNRANIKDMAQSITRLIGRIEALEKRPIVQPLPPPIEVPKQKSMVPIIVFAAVWPLVLVFAWGAYAGFF